jgi:hypothetical protein
LFHFWIRSDDREEENSDFLPPFSPITRPLLSHFGTGFLNMPT